MAEFNLEKVKDRLLVKFPAFASTIINAKYYSTNVPTLCTDGKNIYYNPIFLNNLSFDEQLFCLAHEICHICSNHIMRSKDKNQKIWNIATDAVINMLLKEEGLTLPQTVIQIEDAINYSAEEYYDILLKQQKAQNQNNENQSDGQNQSTDETKDANFNTPSNVDDHSIWQEAVKKASENQTNDKNSNIQENSDQNNQNENDNPNEQELFSKNRQQKIENLKKLRNEIFKQSMQASTDTNSKSFILDEVGKNKQLIDWRTLLKKQINIKLSWDTSTFEVDHGVLINPLRKRSYPKTEILLDTSGSISYKLLKNFLRECKYILHHSEMWVGCFDTKFYGFHKINNEKDIENMTFVGRGETDFSVAINSFSKRVENKIIFTDGKAWMPEEKADIIWIVFGNEEIEPNGGKVIYIDINDLNKAKRR